MVQGGTDRQTALAYYIVTSEAPFTWYASWSGPFILGNGQTATFLLHCIRLLFLPIPTGRPNEPKQMALAWGADGSNMFSYLLKGLFSI